MTTERIPREYAELRIDLSPRCWNQSQDEIENLRNVVRNLLDRFDADLCS